ncbi:hypothetical protein [Cystobacter ferrugineus]|uniref:hypothetical protein n=1 Tax=Cystobacter ferrugineus TaxID=83449 RepID=UPI001160FE25|nr:hypothetical protein [Cystobacter ferrugineus]
MKKGTEMIKHQDMSQRMYEVKCKDGHSQVLTATELEQLIRSSEHECPDCKNPLLTSNLGLECFICSSMFTVSSLEEAEDTIDTGCMDCDERGFHEDSIHINNSWGYFENVYQWRRNNNLDEEHLRRKGRTDFWEAVIHFCKPHEFASIYKEGKIKAGKTGYFGVPAVCLTEIPLGNWKDLRVRHGDFGFVFLKRDLIAAGGGPAIYLSDELIRAQKTNGGFCEEIRPFLNLLRISSVTPGKLRHDFMHEREWRLPNDLLLENTQPYAIIVGNYDMGTEGWEDIWRARLEVEELLTQEDEDTSQGISKSK